MPCSIRNHSLHVQEKWARHRCPWAVLFLWGKRSISTRRLLFHLPRSPSLARGTYQAAKTTRDIPNLRYYQSPRIRHYWLIKGCNPRSYCGRSRLLIWTRGPFGESVARLTDCAFRKFVTLLEGSIEGCGATDLWLCCSASRIPQNSAVNEFDLLHRPSFLLFLCTDSTVML